MNSVFRNALSGVVFNDIPEIIPRNNCCRKTIEEICNVDVALIEKQTRSCKEKWYKERQFRITASRSYELYTYSLNQWEQKARKYFWPKKFVNKYVNHGNQFEPAARRCYVAHTNYHVVETGLIISSQHRWLACSPDGIVFQNNIPWKLLEIKCPFEGKKFQRHN